MKVFKLKTKHYGDLTQLLIDVGAVTLEFTQAFPNHIYVSKEDMKKMTKEVTKLFRKQYPYLIASKIKSAVATHMLNYSPNESLSGVIKSGYVIVDTDAIELEINRNKLTDQQESYG